MQTIRNLKFFKFHPFYEFTGADFYRLAIEKGIRINEVKVLPLESVVEKIDEVITSPKSDTWMKRMSLFLVLAVVVMLVIGGILAVVR
jgi:hypothetical protein